MPDKGGSPQGESAVKLPEQFVFSQSSLQAYVDCPRWFQLRYMLDVQWPMPREGSSLAWERHARLGAAFHRLVQQHLLGIETGRLRATAEEAGVAEWWGAYTASPPPDLPTVRRMELSLRAPINRHALAARYDLVATEPGRRAVIVDWKTSVSRPSRAQLAARMQTLVYRYVLAEAGSEVNGGQRLAPEQIELVYWFANHPHQTERFAYDAATHAAAGERLRSVVAEIAELKTPTWPLATGIDECSRCPYQTLCGREVGTRAEEAMEHEPAAESLELDLEQIAEIEF